MNASSHPPPSLLSFLHPRKPRSQATPTCFPYSSRSMLVTRVYVCTSSMARSTLPTIGSTSRRFVSWPLYRTLGLSFAVLVSPTCHGSGPDCQVSGHHSIRWPHCQFSQPMSCRGVAPSYGAMVVRGSSILSPRSFPLALRHCGVFQGGMVASVVSHSFLKESLGA
jgi:hypothetical protein